LKRHRQFKGFSQKDLAEKVGLTADTISKIELGKYENPGMKYLTAICHELSIGLEELFMENPQKLRIDIIVSDKNVKVIEAIIQVFKNFNLVQ